MGLAGEEPNGRVGEWLQHLGITVAGPACRFPSTEEGN